MRCVVDDDECVPGRIKVGMCEKHYRRLRRTGSTGSPRIDNLRHYEVAENGCWHWAGGIWPNGYGKTSVDIHGTRLAHRAFYIEHVGPVPDGLDIDHMCHNTDPRCERGRSCLHRRCVNPQHLEPASRAVNLVRAIEARTVCEAGLHDLTLPDSVRPEGSRICVECWRIRYRKAGERYREKKRG